MTGLVGPNGAGKTTLLSLIVGLLTPTVGTIEVCGGRPAADAAQLAKVGFVAQDTPTYAGLTVAEHLRLGARLNPRWDDAAARRRIERLGLDPQQKAGRLSGGQRAQLALTLGLAKRPELLVLDEPVASLDPLARREFLQVLMEAVAEDEISVLLSSHVVSDLERVCDHAVVLVDSQVRVAGDVDDLLATHHRLSGPRREPGTLPADQHVVWASHTDRQSTYVVRTDARRPRPGLVDLGAGSGGPGAGLHGGRRRRRAAEPRAGGAPMTWLTWRQLRLPVAVVYALVAAACVWLALTGPELARLARTQRRPLRRAHLHRPAALQRRHRRARAWRRRCSGVFWGAPLVARELETGTYRLAWNQSVTRGRWLATKLVVSVARHRRRGRRSSAPRSRGGRSRSTASRARSAAASPRG